MVMSDLEDLESISTEQGRWIGDRLLQLRQFALVVLDAELPDRS
jgi:hypothetical protein